MEILFWLLVAALVVYEGVTVWGTPAPDDHITAIVRRISRRPLVPFGAGMLAGHFWLCG